VTVNSPLELTLSLVPVRDSLCSIEIRVARPEIRVANQGSPLKPAPAQGVATGLDHVESHVDLPNTWIFQGSPKCSDLSGALRVVEEPVWRVRQFGKRIKPGDRVYLWECGPRGGIIGLAEAAEVPRIQSEPTAQIPFLRESEKFSGDQTRVKLRVLRRIAPAISRNYLLSRPELASLSILRCARGTNFRVTPQQAEFLQKIVADFERVVPNWNGSRERRVVFAEG